MIKRYDVKVVEDKWRNFWDREKIYKFKLKPKKPVFSIDTPPPYASAGHLHVGHALHYTQFEIIARVMRMLGKNVYFAPGYDDNGLPTEKYVEEKFKIDKTKVDRAKFRKLCLEESKKVENIYTEKVFKTLGHSFDWDLLYQTISLRSQKVAQMSFLKLIKKGECYRAKEPTIWCSKHGTALAQAEVEDLNRVTKLNYIEFGDKEKILVATTRPEFLPACVGIFVNPNDKRYKKLVGKEIMVPLFNYNVKVRTDEKVDSKFGTGIVMVCTFGDNADIEWWKKYKLDLKICINKEGKMTDIAGNYKGMKMQDARKAILKDLYKEGRLKKQEELNHTVGSCWRCSTPVEYIITDQWFINTLKHKKKLLEMGNKINWYPKFMKVRYNDWVKNLAWDWAISRQRYYGIPIPVWYCDKCGEIILPVEKELPIDPMQKNMKCKCGGNGIPEKDVFDTWMASSNSPEIALRWLENPNQYKKLAPMSLRPQGHDIIRTWAFYTILKSYLLFNRVPWKDITIGTFILDSKGKRMSKSKGNAIWADELIKKYGVDVFRYWVGTASLGNDLSFKEQELVAGQKFMNKLWNASNFVFMNLEDYRGDKPKKLEEIDKIFLEMLNNMVVKSRDYYKEYNIAAAKREIENFFWKDFADNYIEIVKKRVYQGRGSSKLSAQYTLYISLLIIIKMIAPIIPFITEEIYQKYFRKFEKVKSIHLDEWPKENKIKESKVWESIISFVSEIRSIKTKNKKPMNAEIKELPLSKKELKIFAPYKQDILNVTGSSCWIEGKRNKMEFID